MNVCSEAEREAIVGGATQPQGDAMNIIEVLPPPAPGSHDSDLPYERGPVIRDGDGNVLCDRGHPRGGHTEWRLARRWSRAAQRRAEWSDQWW